MGSRAMSVTDQVLNWVPTPGAKDQHVTVSTEAKTISGLAGTTRFCQLNVQGADVRLTLDGDDPVGGSVGALVKDGSFVYWNRRMVEAVKMIRDAGTDAVVHVQEFSI
jgi:hypothetical protein